MALSPAAVPAEHSYVVRKPCRACRRPDKFVYHVPDEIWEPVVPSILRSRAVCLVCFDDFPAMRRVNYARNLMLGLRFAGDAASFEFEVRRAIPSVYSSA
jgi:hypothetical protein